MKLKYYKKSIQAGFSEMVCAELQDDALETKLDNYMAGEGYTVGSKEAWENALIINFDKRYIKE